MIDLRLNYPVLASQREEWSRRIAPLMHAGVAQSLSLQPYGGNASARAAAGEWLGVDPARVFLCCGGHHAVLVALLAGDLRGRTVAVEPLTYANFKILASKLGVRLVAVETDESGILPPSLQEAQAKHGVAALYTMPTVHNPLGTVTPLERREEIVEVARRAGLLILEDDAYAFLDAAAPPSYGELLPEQTFRVWSLSKPICPGMKCAFLTAPAALTASVEESIRITSSGVAPMVTGLVCELVRDGTLKRWIDEKRIEGRHRQEIARDLLRGRTVQAHPTSWHLWLTLDARSDPDQVQQQLETLGVGVSSARHFALSTHDVPRCVRLSLGGEMDLPRVVEGLQAVARATT